MIFDLVFYIFRFPLVKLRDRSQRMPGTNVHPASQAHKPAPRNHPIDVPLIQKVLFNSLDEESYQFIPDTLRIHLFVIPFKGAHEPYRVLP